MEFYQGETVYIEVEVGEALNGAEAIFGYEKNGVLITKECEIEGTKVKTKFEPSETNDLLGYYKYEFKVTDTEGDIDIVKTGNIKVLKSILREELNEEDEA
jgi:hypothetical protein